MTEMIERVARAIAHSRYGGENTFDRCSPEGKAECMKNAHAAIEVMREPTEAMKERCYYHSGCNGGDGAGIIDEQTAAELFSDMIDAALGKTEGEK